MPFTPFHFGLGIACKSLAPRHIAVLPFFATQVAMDIEPGVRMLLGTDVLHGWTHTWLGAIAVATVVAALWLPLQGRRIWRLNVAASGLSVLVASTMLGALSHVWLDSLMHADMAGVLATWAGDGVSRVDPEVLERGCVLAALGGVAIGLVRTGPHAAWEMMRSQWGNFMAAPAWSERRDR